MNDIELIRMALPYVVSTAVFLVIGIFFYLKDLIFGFFEKRREAKWQKEYLAKTNLRIKRVKSGS